jgi:RNA recognition motif-containing protein
MIGTSSRPIKVLIAASRNMGSSSGKSREDEKAQRLFIIIPKGFTEENLRDEFDKYGEIEDISIIRDRKTKEGKGFAYIKFKKFSYAALAFENCDEKYKAVFAEPKPSRSSGSSNDSGSNSSSNYGDDRYGMSHDLMVSNNGDCALHVICSPMITHDQLWRLFDIVPNMDYCKMNSESDFSSSATVVYKTQQAALHARQKLHGFEYPIGERLIVKLSSEMKSTPVVDTQNFFNNSNGANFCSVNLPSPQAQAPPQAQCAQRCFIVCSPHVLPIHVLKKVFCRFGNLIDVYLLSNRNCGYVKYASHESARQAMKTLHGAEIYGVKLKVLEAEEPSEPRKRSKMDLD